MAGPAQAGVTRLAVTRQPPRRSAAVLVVCSVTRLAESTRLTTRQLPRQSAALVLFSDLLQTVGRWRHADLRGEKAALVMLAHSPGGVDSGRTDLGQWRSHSSALPVSDPLPVRQRPSHYRCLFEHAPERPCPAQSETLRRDVDQILSSFASLLQYPACWLLATYLLPDPEDSAGGFAASAPSAAVLVPDPWAPPE